jgi:uridine phosphorylase
MTRKESFTPLNIVRVGTSGGLNPLTPLGTLVLTDYVIGLDNTGLFYDPPLPDPLCALLEEKAKSALALAAESDARFGGAVVPYAARADRRLMALIEHEGATLGIPCLKGITVSSSGFFAEQGRGVARVAPTFPRLLDSISGMESLPVNLRIENMEMEAGILLHFMGGMGYPAAALCVVINKRSEGTFLTDYRGQILDATRVALGALSRYGNGG